jgi:hypothetical protein
MGLSSKAAGRITQPARGPKLEKGGWWTGKSESLSGIERQIGKILSEKKLEVLGTKA